MPIPAYVQSRTPAAPAYSAQPAAPRPAGAYVGPAGAFIGPAGAFVGPAGAFVGPAGAYIGPAGRRVRRSGAIVGDAGMVRVMPAGQAIASGSSANAIAALRTAGGGSAIDGAGSTANFDASGNVIPGSVVDPDGNNAADSTFLTGDILRAYDNSGNIIFNYAGGGLNSANQLANQNAQGNPTTATTAQTAASQAALYNAVGGALNTTGTTIASIINSGDQVQIASLQSQAQTQIAALQAQAATAQAQGNLQLAQQRAAEAAQMQQFSLLLQSKTTTQMMPVYIIGGLLALGVLGAVVYFATAPRASTTTVRSRTVRSNPTHRRRVLRNPWDDHHEMLSHTGHALRRRGRKA